MKAEQLEDILVLYRTKGLSRRDAGRLVQQAVSYTHLTLPTKLEV